MMLRQIFNLQEKIMRSLIISLLLAVFLSGCFSAQIKTRKDEFTGKTVSTVSYNSISSAESFGIGGNFYFVREYNKKGEASYFNVTVYAGSDSKDIDTKCFVKVNDKTFELSIKDRKAVNVTELQTTTTYNQQANGGYDFTKGQKNTEVGNTYKELSGKVILPEDFKKSVLNATSVLFRVYLGSEPLTFTLSPEWVESLKQFYAAKE
jgi:hypothetical protein